MRDLLRFLKAWRKAAQNNGKDWPDVTAVGLCSCSLGYDQRHKGVRSYDQLQRRLYEEFPSTSYPFDTGAEDVGLSYTRRRDLRTQHLDPVRLAWVDKTIAELSAKVKGR